MRVLALFLSISVLAMPLSDAIAQGHSFYCGNADSTASTQACLKRHLDAAQKRLNTNFKKLATQLESDKRTELENLQKTWLAYRDAECMWEAENTQTPALKYINELSCMARLTDDRADILSVLNEDSMTPEGAREYGSFPRWMNALANVDGGVYWNYGDRTSFDLNCDGAHEFIMSGVETALVKQEPVEVEEGKVAPDIAALYEKNIVVAITQNPSIGKPEATLFKFLVSEGDNPDTICGSDIQLGMIAPELSGAEQEAAEPSCGAKLEVTPIGCSQSPKTVIWSDGKFMIAPQPLDDKTLEE